MKKEGHSHTELCPHGSGDKLEKMVEQAINLGFDTYCVTEHAPLPIGFAEVFGGPKDDIETASLTWDQVDEYIDLVERIRMKYAGQIEIRLGFEIDYLDGFTDERLQFLKRVADKNQESILSVHYMKGPDGLFYGVDYNLEEFKNGYGDWLEAPQFLYKNYLENIGRAVQFSDATSAIKRIGHMSLIKKFQKKFGLPSEFDADNMRLVGKILDSIKEKQLGLDFNTAGIYKEFCGEVYPNSQLVKLAKAKRIPLEFGSDAHAISEVGRGYNFFEVNR